MENDLETRAKLTLFSNKKEEEFSPKIYQIYNKKNSKKFQTFIN